MPESPKQPAQAARAEPETQWLAENREAVASINAFVEQHGLLANKLRYRPEL